MSSIIFARGPSPGSTAFSLPILSVSADHLDDVLARLLERRDAAVLNDCVFPGVIARDRELEIAVEEVRQDAQVSHPSEDVLARIEYVRHHHALGRSRHELHEPSR